MYILPSPQILHEIPSKDFYLCTLEPLKLRLNKHYKLRCVHAGRATLQVITTFLTTSLQKHSNNSIIIQFSGKVRLSASLSLLKLMTVPKSLPKYALCHQW